MLKELFCFVGLPNANHHSNLSSSSLQVHLTTALASLCYSLIFVWSKLNAIRDTIVPRVTVKEKCQVS